MGHHAAREGLASGTSCRRKTLWERLQLHTRSSKQPWQFPGQLFLEKALIPAFQRNLFARPAVLPRVLYQLWQATPALPVGELMSKPSTHSTLLLSVKCFYFLLL